MRFSGDLLLFLLAATIGEAAGGPPASPTPSPSPSPSPPVTASPSPTPRYKLLPYGFETAQERTTVPLLRFEDKTDVRALEMNEAIARFFEKSDDKGNMLRGATPGGAPTLSEMAAYRPHVTAGVDLLGGAIAAAREIKRQIDLHKSLEPVEPTPTPTPSPSPIVRVKG
jgi:hypothetical protein